MAGTTVRGANRANVAKGGFCRADRRSVVRRLVENIGTGLVIALCGATAGLVGWRMGRPKAAPRAPAATAPSPASVLVDAVRAMESAPSYQFSGQVSVGIEVLHVDGTFSSPDRLSETLQLVGGPPVARVVLGPVSYERGPFGWAKVTAAAPVGDPRAVFAALEHSTAVTFRGGDYAFSLTGQVVASIVAGATAQTVVTGSATVANGRVQGLTYETTAGAGTRAAFTYSAVGTAPPVTAPG